MKKVLLPAVFMVICLMIPFNQAFTQNVGIGTTFPAAKLHIVPDTASALQIDPFGSGSGQTGEARFLEITINGVNYIGFKAPDSVATNTIWVLPAADGAAGQVLTTDGAGKLFWSTPSGGGGGSSSGHCFTCDGF